MAEALTVLLPTHGRATLLARTLDSLAACGALCPRFERPDRTFFHYLLKRGPHGTELSL